MKDSYVRGAFVALSVLIVGVVVVLHDAAAARHPKRNRAFSKTLTVGKSFTVASTDCRLAVTNQSASRLNITCFDKGKIRTGRGRLRLRHNQYGTLKSQGCALSVTSRRSSRVNVRCLPVAPAQSFVGAVTCDTPGRTPQSRRFETTVVFDQPINPSSRTASRRVRASAAAQISGLAGSLVNHRRSHMKIAADSSSSSSEPKIDFKVTVDSGPTSFKEKGSWSVGLNETGRVSLRGESTAVLDEAGESWRAKCRWELAGTQDSSVGPVPTEKIKKLLAPPTKGVRAASNGGCGSAYTFTTDEEYVFAAVVSFCTPASAVLSIAAVATTIAGSHKGNSCLTATLDNINQQLATQSYEIGQIQTYLGLATNVFYYAWYQNQVNITGSAVKNWKEQLTKISPYNGAPNAFGSFMYTGLGLWDASLNPAQGAITDPQQLAVSLTSGLSPTSQINVLSQQISAAEIDGFQTWVDDFSGSKVVLPNPTNCGSDCSVKVARDPGSYLILMYEDLFRTLQDNIDAYVPQGQQYNQVANTNIVPLYDEYNAMLVNFYQSALVGLQQALTMEWLINEINYFRAASGITNDQLNSWGEVEGTLYKYSNLSPSAEALAYNKAQQNLAKLYAERVNQLYQNTLGYIVSDEPVAPQIYPPILLKATGTPSTEKAVGYQDLVGNSIPYVPTATPVPGTTPTPAPAVPAPRQGTTPLSLIPPVVNGTWKSAAALYQFSGLSDVATCINSLDDYNLSPSSDLTIQEWLQQPGACPSILVLPDGSPLNQGVYDGNTLAPYTSFQASSKTTGGQMSLTGTMANNLKFCDPTTPALGWYAPSASFVGNAAGLVAGKGYLNCGRWYTPGTRSCGLPRANCPPDASDFYSIQPGSMTFIGVPATSQGCTNNLKINGDKYPWILTLTDSLPSDMKSCSSVIMSVSDPAGNKLSPMYTNARSESGSYWTGSSAGCSIGFIGQGLNNHLPDHSNPGYVQFGMRLVNFTNSGNQGSGSGWVLPILVQANCNSNSHPNTQIVPWNEYQGTTAERGYNCNSQTRVCTILDGTQYRLNVNVASSAQLSVEVIQ